MLRYLCAITIATVATVLFVAVDTLDQSLGSPECSRSSSLS